jgi:copper chaperone CopZ
MKTVLSVAGMHCHACEMLIKEVLEELAGVHSVTVEHKSGVVAVEHDGTVPAASIRAAIESEGYKIRV